MEHDDIRHKLSEYLDGSITAQEKTEIEKHLKTCQECGAALNELQKTIEHIKAIEEINPPAWMTQKIMAKVRAEAEERKNIFQRLFYPLIVKLPLQAVAVLFLAVTAFYIYQDIHPTAKYAESPTQEFAVDKKAPPPVIAKSEAPQVSRQLKEEPQDAMKDDAAAPRTRNELEFKSFAAPAPAKPSEQPVPEKKAMMAEKRAASPQAFGKADMQEQTTSATGAAAPAKAKSEALASLKKAKKSADKTEAGRRFERDIVERHSNGNPKLVVTYQIIDSRKKKLAEERFNSIGERDGIQKEYYASGQLKTEARYGQGKLEWYMEYGLDGVKKIGKSDFDWFWLKK